MGTVTTEMVDRENAEFKGFGDRYDDLRYMRDAFDYRDHLVDGPTRESVRDLPKEDRDRVIDRHKRDCEFVDTVNSVVRNLTRAVNTMGRRSDVAKLIAAAIAGQHRTLQAEMIAALIEVLHYYQDASYDARNADAVFVAGMVDRFMIDVVGRNVVSC